MCKKSCSQSKFFLKDGREIKFGDAIKLSHKEETPLGLAISTITLTVTKENIDKLIEYGYITSKEVKEKKDEIPMKLDFYVRRLAKRLDLEIEIMTWLLSAIRSSMPAIAFQMLLKEISLYMESLEEIPVSKRDVIYFISVEDGEIYTKYTPLVKNFSTFSSFSSKENAEKAKDILHPYINILYGKQKSCKCNPK